MKTGLKRGGVLRQDMEKKPRKTDIKPQREQKKITSHFLAFAKGLTGKTVGTL